LKFYCVAQVVIKELCTKWKIKGKGKGLMEPQNSGSELTTLIVDDVKLDRMSHQGLLKRAGVKNEVVGIHFSGKRFDITLVDKEMPIVNRIELHIYLDSVFLLILFCIIR
jgi:hypothetical protein